MSDNRGAWTRNHDKFRSHVPDSEPTRWLIAQWLVARDHCVTVPPMKLAPTHDEWEDYADGGDLQIVLRIEVKQLSRRFSSAADWPFGQDFIVCARHAWDRAKPKPYAFVIVSECKQHAAIVYGDNSNRWTVAPRSDRRYEGGAPQDFYFCPMGLVTFTPL